MATAILGSSPGPRCWRTPLFIKTPAGMR
jgi:hypothetical protein